MAKFTVDRQTWYRGKGCQNSYLLKGNGKKCCIGFVGTQCGVPNNVMLLIPSVEKVPTDNRLLFPKWMTDEGYSWGLSEAYRVNDDIAITDEHREEELKRIFERKGDEIEFVN